MAGGYDLEPVHDLAEGRIAALKVTSCAHILLRPHKALSLRAKR